MPNHFTTKVKVKGPKDDVARFKATHFRETEPPGDLGVLSFDFNTVIPMPAIVANAESSSCVDNGLAVLGSKLASSVLLGMAKEEGWKQRVVESDPDCIRKAMMAIEAHRQTGHTSWYTWAREHWGTKWNAYELVITNERSGTLNFGFQTAWAPPVPVLEKLIEMWPTLTIQVTGRDEFEVKWERVI